LDGRRSRLAVDGEAHRFLHRTLPGLDWGTRSGAAYRRMAARPGEFPAALAPGQGADLLRARSGFRAHRGDEFIEELVGHLARGGVDQARADLRQFPADLRLDPVAQHRLARLLRERDIGAALGKAGDARHPLARVGGETWLPANSSVPPHRPRSLC